VLSCCIANIVVIIYSLFPPSPFPLSLFLSLLGEKQPKRGEREREREKKKRKEKTVNSDYLVSSSAHKSLVPMLFGGRKQNKILESLANPKISFGFAFFSSF
jgi:hypothetical protein